MVELPISLFAFAPIYCLAVTLISYLQCIRRAQTKIEPWYFICLALSLFLTSHMIRILLLLTLPSRTNGWLTTSLYFYFAGLATSVLLAMRLMFSKVRTRDVKSINDLTFAWTSNRWTQIRSQWTESQVVWLAFIQGTDHLLMFLYAHFILIGSLAVHPTGLGYDMASIGFIAALCDALEGYFMHQAYTTNSSEPVPDRTMAYLGIAATIKYCCFGPSCLFSIYQIFLMTSQS